MMSTQLLGIIYSGVKASELADVNALEMKRFYCYSVY